VWFIALAWAFWSFAFAGASAWSIVPPVALGAVAVNGIMLYAYQRAGVRIVFVLQ